jgi:gamma-glutamylcyclotransferase
MLYFAYGSNMDWNQMRDRCPSAQFVCAALLRDHRLEFTRYSNSVDHKCGVADAVAAEGAKVWGVVYKIAEEEIARLDRCEGFRPGRERDANHYVREERHVYRDGNEKQPLLVRIYFAIREPNPPLPSVEYTRLIVEGAEYWHLPQTYIDELRRIRTTD